MNKFAKALLLALVFSAPVATCAPAVQASPVTAHQKVAQASTQKPTTKKRGIRKRRKASLTTGTSSAPTKAVSSKK